MKLVNMLTKGSLCAKCLHAGCFILVDPPPLILTWILMVKLKVLYLYNVEEQKLIKIRGGPVK